MQARPSLTLEPIPKASSKDLESKCTEARRDFREDRENKK